MKLVTPEEMQDIDSRAINKLGIPGIVLMENAGIGLLDIIRENFETIENLKVGIVCGKGNAEMGTGSFFLIDKMNGGAKNNSQRERETKKRINNEPVPILPFFLCGERGGYSDNIYCVHFYG